MLQLTDLTKQQKKAFESLKKAFSDCNKANICFVNTLNTIVAYNGDMVCGSTDDRNEGTINESRVDTLNRFSADIDQWVDCAVYLKLTPRGISLCHLKGDEL